MELLHNEKERLRKQRLQREERTRQAAGGSSNPSEMTVGSLHGEMFSSLNARLSRAEENRSVTRKRLQDERERKRKAREDQQRRQQELQQQQMLLPCTHAAADMFVGGGEGSR